MSSEQKVNADPESESHLGDSKVEMNTIARTFLGTCNKCSMGEGKRPRRSKINIKQMVYVKKCHKKCLHVCSTISFVLDHCPSHRCCAHVHALCLSAWRRCINWIRLCARALGEDALVPTARRLSTGCPAAPNFPRAADGAQGAGYGTAVQRVPAGGDVAARWCPFMVGSTCTPSTGLSLPVGKGVFTSPWVPASEDGTGEVRR